MRVAVTGTTGRLGRVRRSCLMFDNFFYNQGHKHLVQLISAHTYFSRKQFSFYLQEAYRQIAFYATQLIPASLHLYQKMHHLPKLLLILPRFQASQ
jgi:hypothetical protein